MKDWNFTPEHPISLTLAADARFCLTNYTNDQIWELNFGSSEPPALSLQTTFGLRARTCRIFPRFIQNGQVVNDPAQFYRPVIVHKYYPNYLILSFKPFSSINVQIEYWVPASQVIAGRARITNTGRETAHLQLEWAELLIPSSDGHRMAATELGLTTILAGQTSNLSPVLFLTGGVQAGNSPYPSLNSSFDLSPHAVNDSRWVNASLSEVNASFDLARSVINGNWEAEFARIERINSQGIEINTGNPDWNTVFSLAQTLARQLILQPAEQNGSPSFVLSRQPDQGFSMLGDGSDYSHLWNGQTALDAYYLSNFFLPSSPEILRGLLDNFISTQTAQGDIDWKPGLAGQRSQLLATPVLATLAWIYYEYTHDINYIRSAYSPLLKFFSAWFTPLHDRDQDSIPEWDQPIQTGYDDHPLFSYLYPWSTGLDISTVESPDLIAYLYRDGQSLISMAALLGDQNSQEQLVSTSEMLQHMLEQSWSDEVASYLYRDRDSHIATRGEIIGTLLGAGIMEIQKEYPQPIRPIIVIKSQQERTQPVQIYLHGITSVGAHRVDHIPTSQIRWHQGTGFVTCEYIFKTIEKIEVSGILEDVEVVARVADLTHLDQTLLMPLWARSAPQDKAEILVNLTILNKNKFLSPYGLRPNSLASVEPDLTEEYYSMHLHWVSMVLEGMVKYGLTKHAADVFTRLMIAVLNSIRQEMKFHHAYQSETGKPLGGVNNLASLVPVGLFLKILGIKIISSHKVEITGGNPFPWPVTVKYRGLTVVQHEKKTLVIFPDGQNITVENDHPQLVTTQGP